MENKIFVLYIVSILKLIKIIVHFLQKTLIILLGAKKINIIIEYSNFANVFLFDFVVEQVRYTSHSN